MTSIRAVIIPFNQTRWVGGFVECVRRSAFDAWLASTPSIQVRAFEHDGEVIAHTDELFADPHVGLCCSFRLNLDSARTTAWAVWTEAMRGKARCSINFVDVRHRTETVNGMETNVVVSAGADHVAIVGDSAAYANSAFAWSADGIDGAPSWIQNADRRWENGRDLAGFIHQRRGQRQKVAQPGAGRRPNGASAEIAAALRPRQAEFAAYRLAWAKAAAGDPRSGGPIIGHAAFSKAGGFDGNFAKLIASARRRP